METNQDKAVKKDKMSKEDWIKRHEDIIKHKHDLECVSGRLEQRGQDDTHEYEEIMKQIDLADWAIVAAQAEVEAAE